MSEGCKIGYLHLMHIFFPDCGKAYHSKDGLETHINEVHLQTITHFCEQCGDQFNHKSQFRRHMKRHDEQNLKCLHCEKTFIRRMQLFTHLKMHTKLRPYKCASCNYSSERKGNVSLHVREFLMVFVPLFSV